MGHNSRICDCDKTPFSDKIFNWLDVSQGVFGSVVSEFLLHFLFFFFFFYKNHTQNDLNSQKSVTKVGWQYQNLWSQQRHCRTPTPTKTHHNPSNWGAVLGSGIGSNMKNGTYHESNMATFKVANLKSCFSDWAVVSIAWQSTLGSLKLTVLCHVETLFLLGIFIASFVVESQLTIYWFWNIYHCVQLDSVPGLQRDRIALW